MTGRTKKFLINSPIVLFVFLLCLIIGVKTTIMRAFGTVATGAVAAALQSPVAGTAPKTVYLLVAASVFYALIPFVPLMIILFWKTKHDKTMRILTVFISILLFVWCLYPCIKDVFLMVHNYDRPNELLRNYYISPENVKISFPRKKRNLIFIIAESMESTFFQKNYGGALNDNIIPELYGLARDNVCFSVDGGCLGMKPTRDHWTSAAIVAQTSGIPFIVPLDKSGNTPKRKSIPGVTSMFDILHDNGYRQMFICGSDIRFADRDIYLKTHNVDFVYDLNTAKREHFIPAGYHDGWWGMEDKKMFEYAKKKADRHFEFILSVCMCDFNCRYTLSGGQLP